MTVFVSFIIFSLKSRGKMMKLTQKMTSTPTLFIKGFILDELSDDITELK